MKDNIKKLHEFSGSGEFFDDMWVLFEADGQTRLEFWRRADGRDEDTTPQTIFEVFRHDIPEDVYADQDWAHASAVASYIGDTEEKVLAEGKDENSVTRAHCLVDIANYYGWENIDSYPLRLTAVELWERWGDDKRDDPRHDLLDDQYDGCILDGREVDKTRLAGLQEAGVERLLSALVSAGMGGWDFWKALGEASYLHAKMRNADEKPDMYPLRRVASALVGSDTTKTLSCDPGTVCFLTNPSGGYKLLRTNPHYMWVEEGGTNHE
jgi:hypothetical protein